MAHELSFTTTATPAGSVRVAQMFSVRETPWHREGHVLTGAPAWDDGLAMAGHAYTVAVQPTYRRLEVPSLGTGAPVEDYVESRTARVTVRTDTGAELGAVGMGYRPIQNAEAFAALRPLVDAGVASLETGGTLRGGADAWLLVRFDVAAMGSRVRDVFGEGADAEVIPFGLVANNHSGRRGCLLTLTPIRVVCANTLGMAEGRVGRVSADSEGAVDGGRAILVRHTESGPAKVIQAAEQLFTGIARRYELVAAQYDALKRRALVPAEFEHLVLDVVAPDPRRHPQWNPDARTAAGVVERADARRAELVRLWTEGDGHRGDLSAWEGYNAVTQAIDHNSRDLWPIRGGVYRTASLLSGTYAELKQTVLNRLVAVSV